MGLTASTVNENIDRAPHLADRINTGYVLNGYNQLSGTSPTFDGSHDLIRPQQNLFAVALSLLSAG